MKYVMMTYVKRDGTTVQTQISRAQLYKYLAESDWKFTEDGDKLYIETLDADMLFDITEIH
jgi:hypothetical protein